MKRLSTWDRYVREASKQGDRSVELPLTPDETFVITYPTRRQGRVISRAQQAGDTDAMLIAMLGEKAGKRVIELAEDQPAYVLDEFLTDVMKKFGLLPDDDEDENDETSDTPAGDPETPEVLNAGTNGGKRLAPDSTKPSGHLSIASS